MEYIICLFVSNSYSSNKDDSWIVEIISLGIHSWLSVWRPLFFIYLCPMCTSIIGIMPLLFSHQVVSDSSWFHGLQYARLPYPSPSPRGFPSSCPLNWQCYITISSSVTPFSSCPQSFPASGSFPMSQLFTTGHQSIK